jgi:hypothetical protein
MRAWASKLPPLTKSARNLFLQRLEQVLERRALVGLDKDLRRPDRGRSLIF